MIHPPPPAELDYMVKHIGPEATLALIEQLGGVRVYVARNPEAQSALVRAIGLDKARALAEEFGGGYIKPPLAKYWRAVVYQRRGLSYAQIARKLGCTEKTVGVYLQVSRRNTAQLALPL